MTAECSMYRNLIPRAMFGDLAAEDQQSLSLHLAECAPCSREHGQYAETLRLMRSLSDVPVPRHFFVYAEQRFENPWQALRRMSLAWQGAIAGAILLLGVFAAAAAFHLHVRAENGAWTLSLGELNAAQIAPAPAPFVDTAAIEARVLQAVEDKNRREKLEWVRALRIEIEKTNRSMDERQRKILQSALSDLELRLGGQIAATARGLEDRSDRAVANLYQIVSTEQERNLAAFNSSLNRLAVNGESRSNQTDAILETILQVAELKLK